jgi:hypothetical protein
VGATADGETPKNNLVMGLSYLLFSMTWSASGDGKPLTINL